MAYTINTFGSLSSDTKKWNKGVLQPNGKIYGIPYFQTQILEFDPNTHQINLFGNLSGVQKWAGGVLQPNGKIYGLSSHYTQILEFDPNTHQINLFGNLGGNDQYLSGSLQPNGKIYGIPFQARSVLEFDPNTYTINFFGTTDIGYKWPSSVLQLNCKIYGIPYQYSQILEFDPNTKQITLFGNLLGRNMYEGAILQLNGKIYGIPQDQTQILEFDPNTHQINLFGNLYGTQKWSGGVLQSNGKIYGMPNNSTQILEFDPNTHQINLFGNVSGGWSGGVLQPNGKIYGVPFNATSILEIDVGQPPVSDIDSILYPPFIPSNLLDKYLFQIDNQFKYWNGVTFDTLPTQELTLDNFDTYGINNLSNIDITQLPNNFDILYYPSAQGDYSITNPPQFNINAIPYNQTIIMNNDISTFNFKNIDKITLNYTQNLQSTSKSKSLVQNNTNFTIDNNLIIDTGVIKLNNTDTGIAQTNSILNLFNVVKINTLTINHSMPENTDIRILVSFDNKQTWKYYNGTEFITTSLDDINTIGNTISEIQSLFTDYQVKNTDTIFDIQISLITDDISVSPSITSINISYTLDSQLRILLSNDKGTTWYGYYNNQILPVDINNDKAIYNYGFDANTLNTIHESNPNIWNEFITSDNVIRFQFYLSENEQSDILELDILSMQVDIAGTWKLQSDTDYDYSFPQNNILRVTIYTDGSYKINYNVIDYTPPNDLKSFTQSNVTAGIELTWTPPDDYDYQGVIIRKSTIEFPMNISEGEFVYQGGGTKYTDVNVEIGNIYYYTAFPYDNRTPTNINLSVSTNNRVQIERI